MKVKNTEEGFGLVSVFVHWIFAVAFIGLFGLGLYMVGLDYYDPWYTKGPWLHESIGVLLAAVLLGRIIWRLANIVPKPEEGMSKLEVVGAHLAHIALYVLPLAIVISGYLITTADGRPITVFNWGEVPAFLLPSKERADIAGLVHEYLAYGAMAIVFLHLGAALKHHFIDKDGTLMRMLKPTSS